MRVGEQETRFLLEYKHQTGRVLLRVLDVIGTRKTKSERELDLQYVKADNGE